MGGMTAPTPNNLSDVIVSAGIRRGIYSGYVFALVGAGAAQVAYASLEIPSPDWLTATVAVLAFLGIPVGSLAAVNVHAAPDLR